MAPRPVRSSFRMPRWPYAIVRYRTVIRDKPVKDSNGASAPEIRLRRSERRQSPMETSSPVNVKSTSLFRPPDLMASAAMYRRLANPRSVAGDDCPWSEGGGNAFTPGR